MSLKTEYKIIADHLRSSCFLIADGILPSNEGRGYVLRRIIRRSVRQIHKLGAKNLIMHQLVEALIAEMGENFPELNRAKNLIIETLKNEEEKFRETLENGLKILDDEIFKIKNSNNPKQKLSGEIAFKLYDTFGFPLDLTQNICQENNLEIDLEKFEEQMENQRQRARQNWAGSGEVADDKIFFTLKEKYGETKFLYHQTTKAKAKILGIYHNFLAVKNLSNIEKKAGDVIFIILDQTPFYATSGGQKGDDGNLFLASDYADDQLIDYDNSKNFIDILETKKFAGNLFAHFVADFKGNFQVGDEILALVNNRHRQFRAQTQSAAHLLHEALKEVLGNHISQKGSNVDAKQLTFDFNLNRAMTLEEIEQVEELVNFYIRQNSKIHTNEMAIEDARNSGAEALFGEKYDDIVRVVAMGPSVELCGGTHVENTGNIGIFKIISENGVASGIRRITAKSGFYALQHLKLQEQKFYALLNSLKVKQQFDEVKIAENEFLSSKVGYDDLSFFNNENTKQIINQSQSQNLAQALEKTTQIGIDFLQNIKEKDKEILRLKQEMWQQNLQNLQPEIFGNIKFCQHIFKETDSKDLREIMILAQKSSNFSTSQILLFFGTPDQKFEQKVAVCLAVSNDLTNQFDASKILPQITEIIGGKGGGGKKDMAMGAGIFSNKIPDAINFVKQILQKN
ncbi:MAG: alanine--tRNA ligase [Alphaproteobacteria bacterium]